MARWYKQTRLIATAAILGAIPQIAHADWEKTKWGMTGSQIEAVLGKRVTKVPGTEGKIDGLRALYQTAYNTGAFEFLGFLLFDESSRLQEVQLLHHGECQSLGKTLLAKYGKPAASDQDFFPDTDVPYAQTYLWLVPAMSNTVHFKIIKVGKAETCFLTYTPLASSKGL